MIPFTSNIVLFREITFISSFFITLMPAPAMHPLISAAKHQFLLSRCLSMKPRVTYTNDTENSSLRGLINGIRWRDSAWVVRRCSLTFLLCSNRKCLVRCVSPFFTIHPPCYYTHRYILLRGVFCKLNVSHQH